eukprot:TRINITY_DN1488_c0_g1_i1.p1 TRINITY_DN1488_c0_g1~~TRINITY_DN1488_c0_g1_i1.p1  ORF type:complete len:207 (+),score=72.77 TRINITY_DN1488_c0_g1_i1:75-623(+)
MFAVNAVRAFRPTQPISNLQRVSVTHKKMISPSSFSSSFSSSSVLPPNLRLGRLNHVAIAVPDLAAAISLYRDVLGAEVSEPQPQVEHGVTTVFVKLDNTKIELLHPLGENSPIANFLQKKSSGGIHHICIEVDDINAAVEELNKKGIKLIDKKPKIGAHGKPVVFIHPSSMNGVLVEFEQK